MFVCVCLLAKETCGFLKQLCGVIHVFKAFGLMPEWTKSRIGLINCHLHY